MSLECPVMSHLNSIDVMISSHDVTIDDVIPNANLGLMNPPNINQAQLEPPILN